MYEIGAALVIRAVD